jgi:uncharacterized Tic20 family protein
MSQKDKDKYNYKGRENYEFSMAAVSICIIAMVLLFIGYALVTAINNIK